MPTPFLRAVHDAAGTPTKELEHKWDRAKEIVKDQYNKSESDGSDFWALVTGVFKKMIGKDALDKVQEETTTQDVALPPTAQPDPDGYVTGFPYFKVSDDTFWSLHKAARKDRQWYKTWTGGDLRVADWAKRNAGKSFYVTGESAKFLRMVKNR